MSGSESAKNTNSRESPADLQQRLLNMSPYDIVIPNAGNQVVAPQNQQSVYGNMPSLQQTNSVLPAYPGMGNQNFQQVKAPQFLQQELQPLSGGPEQHQHLPPPGGSQNINPQRNIYEQSNLSPNPYIMQDIKQQQLASPSGMQPQQKIYPTRTPTQREIYIHDLLLKYPDIMTIEEQSKTNKLKDYILFGMLSGMVTLPYSIYLGMKARRNPTLRSKYVKRMAFLPTGPLLVILITGWFADRHFKLMSSKYFDHLSDTDLDNFETYYHLLKSGMPAQAQFKPYQNQPQFPGQGFLPQQAQGYTSGGYPLQQQQPPLILHSQQPQFGLHAMQQNPYQGIVPHSQEVSLSEGKPTTGADIAKEIQNK